MTDVNGAVPSAEEHTLHLILNADQSLSTQVILSYI